VLPFVEHTEPPAVKPALTLDRLEEAFAHLGEPAPEAAREAGPSTTAQPSTAAGPSKAAEPVKGADMPAPAPAAAQEPIDSDRDRFADHSDVAVRTRRPRRNRSASRAQGAANETSVEHHEPAPGAAAGHSHEAKVPSADNRTDQAAAPQAADAPIILGVGVPASEL
jgi:ribonuclease E